jgi:hypothetical protein
MSKTNMITTDAAQKLDSQVKNPKKDKVKEKE